MTIAMKNLDKRVEYEKYFLDLFGFYCVGPDNGDRYQVFDEDSNNVGFIQLKFSEEGPECYMEINTPNLQVTNHRELKDQLFCQDFSNEESFRFYAGFNDFNFTVVEENGDKYQVKLGLGHSNPSLSVTSLDLEERKRTGKDYVEALLNVTPQNFTFQSEVCCDNKASQEKMKMEFIRNHVNYCSDLEYLYNTNFSDEKNSLKSLNVRLDGFYKEQIFATKDYDEVSCQIRKIEYPDVKNNEKEIVASNLNEIIASSPLVSESYARFSNLVNGFIPLNENIISLMMKYVNTQNFNSMVVGLLTDSSKKRDVSILKKGR